METGAGILEQVMEPQMMSAFDVIAVRLFEPLVITLLTLIAWHAPFSLAAAFAAGMLDPLAIASAFIPVIGHARLAGMLSRASGPLQRAFIRAGQGAASGAVGAAVLEPVVSAEQQALQRDYSMAQSLINVSMGAALGGIIAPVAGKVTEWRNARGGRYNDYEFIAPSEESNSMLNAYREQIYRARMTANPNQNPDLVWNSAGHAARTLDREIRHTAWAERIDVGQAYAKHKVGIVNGEEFRQEMARLENEAAAIRQELDEYGQRQRMAEESYTRVADASDLVRDDRARLEQTEARLAEAKRIAEADWREMTEGGSLYMARAPEDWNGVDLTPQPELVRRVEALKPVDVQPMNWLPAEGENIGDIRKGIMDWAKKEYAAIKTVFNESSNTNQIISRISIKSLLSHNPTREKLLCLPCLPELCRTAEYTGPGYKRGDSISHIYVNRVVIDSREYMAGLIFKENNHDRRLYDVELAPTEEALNKARLRTPRVGAPRDEPFSASRDSLSEGNASVNKNVHKNKPALKEKYTGAVTNILRHRLGVEADPRFSLFQLSPPDPANPGAPQQIMGAYTPGDNPVIRVFRG